MLWLTAFLFSANLFVHFVLNQARGIFPHVRAVTDPSYGPILVGFAVMLIIAAAVPRLPHGLRIAVLMLAVAYACLGAIREMAFQVPNAFVGLAMVSMLLVITRGPRYAYVGIGFNAACLAWIARSFIDGSVTPSTRVLDPTQLEHWARVIVIFISICSAATLAASYLVRKLEDELARSEDLSARVIKNHQDRIETLLQQQELEAQLRHKQRVEAIGHLAGGIAHDFNNLLAIAEANLTLTVQDLAAGKPVEHSTQSMQAAIDHAKTLVRQIVMFSRRETPVKVALALPMILSDVGKLLVALVPPGVELKIDVAANTPAVMGDASQLRQVILNLALHAKQALSGRKGLIAIDARALPSGAAQLQVRHNGEGLDAETTAKLFEPFASTGRKNRRSELGLATAHDIVVDHGGRIAVESDPATGTVFTVELPATNEPVAHNAGLFVEAIAPRPPLPARPPTPQETPAASLLRVLYVEDEQMLATGYARLLRRLGCAVEMYSDPAEALQSFERDPSRFDFVLTDFAMPGMSGVELAEQLVALRPGLRVVLLSGYLEEVRKSTALHELLTKPCGIDELERLLERLRKGTRPV